MDWWTIRIWLECNYNFYGSLTLVTNDQRKMECDLSYLNLLLRGVLSRLCGSFRKYSHYAYLCAMELIITLTKNLLVNDKITASSSTNILPIPSIISKQDRALFSLDQTVTNNKNELWKTVKQVFKNPQFQSVLIFLLTYFLLWKVWTQESFHK